MLSDRAINPNELLGKVGYVSERTDGYYGGLLQAEIATRVVNGKEKKYPTWNHVITCALTKPQVVKPGDSGSLIFTQQTGEVVGMCVGGSSRGDIGYFTHIGDILDNIREVSGVSEIRLRT